MTQRFPPNHPGVGDDPPLRSTPMTLDGGGRLRRDGGPLWRQIARIVGDEIEGGTLPPGLQLPTEAVLADRFGVNRHTVRRAIAHLAAAGLVQVRHGHGTFARAAILDYPLAARTRFTASAVAEDLKPNRLLLWSGETTAEPRVARALAVPEGAPVLAMTTMTLADGVEVGLARHWFPLPRCAGLDAAVDRLCSITAAFREIGIDDYTRKRTVISAAMPTVEEAERLRLPADRPVLQTEAVNMDTAGVPVEYGISRMPGDRVRLTVG